MNKRNYELDITWLRDESLEGEGSFSDPEALATEGAEKDASHHK